MTSYNSKNSTESKNITASPSKREEVAPRVTYLDLWNKGMSIGMIAPERKSKPCYYHFIYKSSLIKSLADYEAADETGRAEIAKKIEDTLVREGRKRDLWLDGLETGLIDEKWPLVCDERNYYTTFPLKELEDAITAYNAAWEKDNNDIATFDKMAAAFSKRLENTQPVKPYVPNAKTGSSQTNNRTSTISGVKQTPPTSAGTKTTVAYIPRNGNAVTNSGWASLAGKRTSLPIEVKNTNQQVNNVNRTSIGQTRKSDTEDEYSDISIPLLAEWREGCRIGLIQNKNRFHRGIPGYITTSELKALIQEYNKSDKETQTAMSSLFNDELEEFNDITPSISRAFKVMRTYENIWKEADAAGIIPEEFEYRVDFAEWLPSKDLVSYIQAIATMMHRKERQSLRVIFSNSVAERLEIANEVLGLRRRLDIVSMTELLAFSVDNRISSRDVVYDECENCAKHINKTDLISAVSSWMYNTDDISKARYTRWHIYRKCLHNQECTE